MVFLILYVLKVGLLLNSHILIYYYRDFSKPANCIFRKDMRWILYQRERNKLL